MKHRSTWHHAVALFVALSALACGSTPDAPSEPAPAEAGKPWTVDFQQRTALIADVIEIEGPAGII
ncbi:MAG TPA: hypothetical protein VM509_14825, partial [Planctomycetota bacterium]|nr:hypothetical protein [Planctomycetota bacterium]